LCGVRDTGIPPVGTEGAGCCNPGKTDAQL
jgi:hypothetical protein